MKLTRKGLVKKLDKVFSIYIRTRFAKNEIAECVTCGKKDHWKNLQAGHFMSRKNYSTRWHPTNVQVQCSKCNVFNYGEQYKFGLYLEREYGVGTAEELRITARGLVKLANYEIEDKIKYYIDLST